MDRSNNPWHCFIKENPELLDVDFIVKVWKNLNKLLHN